jgi:hypothetical protein
MRRKSFAGLILALVAMWGLGAMGTNAYAQATPGPAEIVADIPFSFMVNNMTFPAGKYEFREVSENPWEFEISTVKGDFKALFLTEPSQQVTPRKPTQLDFNQYGDHYFLSKIWLEGNEIGYYLGMMGIERKYMKKTAPMVKSVPAMKKK